MHVHNPRCSLHVAGWHSHLMQHFTFILIIMKVLACIALLLCAVNAADALRYITIGQRTKAAAASWTRPWFCGDLECPRFKNLTKDEDYEVREYSPGAAPVAGTRPFAYTSLHCTGLASFFILCIHSCTSCLSEKDSSFSMLVACNQLCNHAACYLGHSQKVIVRLATPVTTSAGFTLARAHKGLLSQGGTVMRACAVHLALTCLVPQPNSTTSTSLGFHLCRPMPRRTCSCSGVC